MEMYGGYKSYRYPLTLNLAQFTCYDYTGADAAFFDLWGLI